MSITLARSSETEFSLTSRLGMDCGFAERSISTGSVWMNSTVVDVVTLWLSMAVAVMVTLPVVPFGP